MKKTKNQETLFQSSNSSAHCLNWILCGCLLATLCFSAWQLRNAAISSASKEILTEQTSLETDYDALKKDYAALLEENARVFKHRSLDTLTPFYELLETDAPFIVVIESSSCGYCEMYREDTLNDYLEMPTYPILMLEMVETFPTESHFLSFIFEYEINFGGTPTTLFFDKGELVSEAVGVMTREELDEQSQLAFN